MYPDWPLTETTRPAPAWRAVAAAALRAAGAALDRLARQLAHVEATRPATEPVLEFHAEAGAPEGALYVDGRLVGTLPGVNRL